LNETALGLIGAVVVVLVAVVADRALAQWLTSRAEHRSRKSFLSALLAEVQATVHGLRESLEISKRSGHANILEFLHLVGRQASAGSVFLGLLSNLGLISPSLVHELAAAYVKVRVAAQMGEALAAKRSVDMITGGEVDHVRQEISTALAVLEHVEADLARSLN